MIRIRIECDEKKDVRGSTLLLTIADAITGPQTEYDLISLDSAECLLVIDRARKIACPNKQHITIDMAQIGANARKLGVY